jgi:hypothetical protein
MMIFLILIAQLAHANTQRLPFLIDLQHNTIVQPMTQPSKLPYTLVFIDENHGTALVQCPDTTYAEWTLGMHTPIGLLTTVTAEAITLRTTGGHITHLFLKNAHSSLA